MVKPQAPAGKRTHKSNLIIIAAIVILVALAGVLVIAPFTQSQTTLQVGRGVFSAQLALNDADREKGLAGVTALPANKALLLAFTSDSKWQIWMKDMKIPIDIVWLNSNKQVVYIVKDAPVSGGTNVIYTPQADARYVAEFATGTVDNDAIKLGQTATFDLNAQEIR